jgi:hypothetical protein
MEKMSKIREFGDDYPCGPCPNNWDNCKCKCGWVFNEKEVLRNACEDYCECCEYCGCEKCPKCLAHLHCGGCI